MTLSAAYTSLKWLIDLYKVPNLPNGNGCSGDFRYSHIQSWLPFPVLGKCHRDKKTSYTSGRTAFLSHKVYPFLSDSIPHPQPSALLAGIDFPCESTAAVRMSSTAALIHDSEFVGNLPQIRDLGIPQNSSMFCLPFRPFPAVSLACKI